MNRRAFLVIGPLTTIALFGCGQASQVSQSEMVVGRAMATVHFAIPDEDVANLPKEFTANPQQFGMVRVSGGYDKTVPLAEYDISDGASRVKTDENGNFSFPKSTTRSLGKVKLITDDENIDLTKPLTRLKDSSSVQQFTVNVEYFNCCNGMDKTVTRGEPMNDNPNDGNGMRCLDYNGKFSDTTGHNIGNYGVGKDYSASENAKAFRNFIGSDCDFSLPWCVLDHKFKGGCWARHQGCSRFNKWTRFPWIEHIQVWHKD